MQISSFKLKKKTFVLQRTTIEVPKEVFYIESSKEQSDSSTGRNFYLPPIHKEERNSEPGIIKGLCMYICIWRQTEQV